VAETRPETRYAPVGETDVAYQVIGRGPPDLLYFSPLGSNIDLVWDSPDAIEFFGRLASFCRLILFDRRGTGVSDPVPRNSIPTWEDLSEDAGAVLDAVETPRAAILATAESGPMALLFAAMHPDRVGALVLVNSYARFLSSDDYPIGVSREMADLILKMVLNGWGTRAFAQTAVPSRSDDPELLDFVAKSMRSSATPRNAVAQYEYMQRNIDARQVLPLIQAPTLVLQSDNDFMPPALGLYVVEHIEGAKFVALPGSDIGLAGDHAVTIADEMAEFLTGERPVEINRILATVLFTDIVNSTGRAAALGDRRWRTLLDSHDRAVREQLRRFNGREINTTGDGFVASFDGPARAIRCALAIVDAVGPLELHIGLHTGECEVRGNDLGGLAVHIAARVSALAAGGEVLVSGTVKDLVVGSGIAFEERGEHELKGVPGTWRIFAAAG
jgi:class 3 adenylate cyclase